MDPHPPDIPSPIDLQSEADAQAWAATAQQLRPGRTRFFETMAEAIAQAPARAAPGAPLRVLELGAGPGFLAEHLLARHPGLQIVLLDFSAPMQALARQRLQAHAHRVTAVCRSFKGEGWAEGLGRFSHVLTHQAVHELRHKRHALPLHRQVRQVLLPGGQYLVSDHYFGDDGMQNPEKAGLYMTIDEQRQALLDAGFTDVQALLRLEGMVLHRAVQTPTGAAA